jgi:hypothetical protein
MTTERIAETIEAADEALDSGESPVKAILGATLTFIALVTLWELLVREFNVPGWILPAPSAIAIAFAEWRGELARHSLVTLYETVVGFALATAISIPLAAFFNPFPRSRSRRCSPYGSGSACCRRSWSCSWSASFQSSWRLPLAFRQCRHR